VIAECIAKLLFEALIIVLDPLHVLWVDMHGPSYQCRTYEMGQYHRLASYKLINPLSHVMIFLSVLEGEGNGACELP